MNTTPLQNRALMLDAQANLLDATTQQPLLMASDWQLDAKAARQSLQEKQVDLAELEVLWVPTELVVFSQAVVPGKRASDAQKALPYVLEANLALPIEDYFIVVLEKHKTTDSMMGFEFSVALVAHAQMTLWRQAVNGLQITQVALLPDCFRLPRVDKPQKYCFKESEQVQSGRCLVRTNQHAGFACPSAWGESLWQLALANSKQTLPITSTSEDAELDESIEATQLSFMQLPSVPPENLLGSHLPKVPAGEKLAYRQLNLFQAEYANQANQSGLLKVGVTTAVLSLLLVILLLVETLHESQQLQAQAASYQQQTQKLFTQMFPDVKRVVNIKAQTISRLKSKAKVEQQADLLAWLSAVESLMSMVPEVTVQRLEWNGSRQHLKLALSATNSQQLARLSTLAKQKFAQFPISIATQSVQPNQIEAQLNVR